MKIERNYEFRKLLREVHIPLRRDPDVQAASNEIVVQNSWNIVWDNQASRLVTDAAKDLQDYFFTSMGVSLLLQKSG